MRKKLKTPGLKTKRRSAIRMNGGAVNSSCAGCWGKEHHHEQFFDTRHCVRRACGAGFFGGAEQVAFTGATLHPVDGEPVENGVLLVEDGRIAAVGRDVEVPADARRVDLSGRHVYPGMIHAGTVLGLTEIGSVPGTEDYSEMGQVNAAIRAETVFNADSM